MKKWLPQYLMTEGERSYWVIDPRGLIKKSTLTFLDRFFWLLVLHRLLPTNVYIVITWDREVMVEALVTELEVDFVRVVLSIIYERTFKSSTTYPFAFLIFQLFRDAKVPICHCDTLRDQWGKLI